MSINALQGAAIVAAHTTISKMFLSFTYRTYQYFEWDPKRRQFVEDNFHVQQFQKAQVNESEYAALLVALLLYLASMGIEASTATTSAVVGQLSYVWIRTAIRYPKLPTISAALLRYAGLALVVAELWNVAF
jgi:hypothetical protein